MSYGIANTNTIHFLRAAFKQGITIWPLWATCYGFGTASRMRRLDSSLTDQTSSMAVKIAQNKALSASILSKHGISTPQHKVVKNLEQAIQYANEIGYPIVVKPDNQEQGRGVSAGIRNSSSLEVAFKNSQTFSKNIIIEKHYFGQEYRLTVFNDQVLKVIQRLPCSVIGDGMHTIDELVRLEQSKERYKRIERETGKLLIQLDEEALDLLRERDYNINTIPSIGDVVVLRRKSNLSAGGSQSHVSLDFIHPDNLNLAVRASQAVGLDLCGVDLIMPDISQSWIEVDAIIIELNSIPQIGIDIAPETYDQILARIGQDKWTIPVQLLVCESNSTIPSYADIINFCGPADGISTANGVWLSGKLIDKNPNNGFDASAHLLMNTTVKKAICCLTVDEIVKFGLPIPFFDSVILDRNFTTDTITRSKWKFFKDILTAHTPKILGTSAKS
jgi:cyanophycin synthetase